MSILLVILFFVAAEVAVFSLAFMIIWAIDKAFDLYDWMRRPPAGPPLVASIDWERVVIARMAPEPKGRG